MHSKLTQDGADRVNVKDIRQRRLLGQYFQWLWSRDEQEAGSQEQTLQRGLRVTELDAVYVKNRLAVSRDECVQSENLEHLQSGD